MSDIVNKLVQLYAAYANMTCVLSWALVIPEPKTAGMTDAQAAVMLAKVYVEIQRMMPDIAEVVAADVRMVAVRVAV